MLTKEEFKNAGYEVGLNCDQNAINRAERDINDSYIKPILAAGDEGAAAGCVLRKVTLDLTYMLLCQRSIQVTRAGGRTKNTLQGNPANDWNVIAEMAGVCDFGLMQLCDAVGAPRKTEVNDICKIYFKTNFFNN